MKWGIQINFKMIANNYDTAERVKIAKVSSDAIRECLVDARNRNAIDFGCGTGLVGMNLIKEFNSMLFVDSSPKMICEVEQKLTHLHIQDAEMLYIDFEKEYQADIQADCILWSKCCYTFKMDWIHLVGQKKIRASRIRLI